WSDAGLVGTGLGPDGTADDAGSSTNSSSLGSRMSIGSADEGGTERAFATSLAGAPLGEESASKDGAEPGGSKDGAEPGGGPGGLRSRRRLLSGMGTDGRSGEPLAEAGDDLRGCGGGIWLRAT